MTSSYLPYYACGEVVAGFGRGSKELGVPTANYPERVVDELPRGFPLGVYYGFATVGYTTSVTAPVVYKMVMNIGYCPFYKNRNVAMETHIIHTFDTDFYGQTLKIIILGFIRPEKTFDSVADLIDAINGDIQEASRRLDQDVYSKYRADTFFTSMPVSNDANHKL